MITFKIKQEPRTEIIPDILCDAATKKRYQRGRFLGKGDFAKCYELTDLDNGQIFAGKIVSKQLLVKPHLKEKMAQEISIHHSLKHEHVVGFHSFFEDNDFVYLVLELCSKRSLKELYERRKAVTEPEARYFMHQLLLGVKYLHENKMIHRDLKVENLLLNDDMKLKIGDFGLATKLDSTEEMKKTFCGTPNYIAPEVLNQEGHSFGVDVWSMGCILYTLLVGRPPFETQSFEDTFSKIKQNDYHIPSQIGPLARALITRMLQGDPACRPAVDIVLNDEFMTCGYMPTRLPLSCLTMAPRFDAKLNSSIIAVRRPLGEVNRVHLPGTAELPQGKGLAPTNKLNHGEDAAALYTAGPAPKQLLSELQQQLSRLIKAKPSEKFPLMMDEAEDPGSVPIVWISKWVRNPDEYAFGYQLSDDTIGVFFNDSTTLLLLVDAKTIQYVERNGNELYYTMDQYPDTLKKKVKLLAWFRAYMEEKCIKTGASVVPRDGDEHLRLPILRQWSNTSRAVVMHLTSGTLQINYFKDHVKLILCPRMGAVTVIDEKKNFRTYKFSLLAEHGCNIDLLERLQYAHKKLLFFSRHQIHLKSRNLSPSNIVLVDVPKSFFRLCSFVSFNGTITSLLRCKNMNCNFLYFF